MTKDLNELRELCVKSTHECPPHLYDGSSRPSN